MKKKMIIVLGALVAAMLCIGVVACAPKPAPEPAPAPDPSGTEPAPSSNITDPTAADFDLDGAIAVATATDPYLCDAVCLSCHGKTYENLAKLTSKYGVQNPHDSIHGGPNSCDNCHARGNELTDNMCDNCHAWPRDDASIGLRPAA